MHAAALAAAVSIRTAEDFGQHPAGIEFAGNTVSVPTMGAGQKIVRLHGGATSYRNGLHAHVEMRGSRDQSGLVEFIYLLFELADTAHASVPLQRTFIGKLWQSISALFRPDRRRLSRPKPGSSLD